jgi:hypothetical protein
MGFYFSKDAVAIFWDHVCTAGRKVHQTGARQMAAGSSSNVRRFGVIGKPGSLPHKNHRVKKCVTPR